MNIITRVSDFERKEAVYGIFIQESNAIYIGSTNNLARRIRQHKHRLGQGTHRNMLLQEQYSLYGWDSFKFVCIHDICDKELEGKTINSLKSQGYKILNIQGVGECEHTELYSKRISAAGKGRDMSALKGRPRPEHVLAKLKEMSEQRKKPILVSGNGLVNQEFESVWAAAESLGIERSNLLAVLNGRRNKVRGYTATYLTIPFSEDI